MRSLGWMHAAATQIGELLLPAVCPACQLRPGPGLCSCCEQAIERIAHPCPRCAAALRSPQQTCPHCAGRGLPGIARVQVLGVYRGVLEQLIRRAKVSAHVPSVRALSAYAAAGAELASRAVRVLSIPANPGRREGPHLATACARAIARAQQLEYRSWLRTSRYAAEQHRLDRGLRRQAVRGLFVAQDAAEGRVLLVDDILTSGSTVSAAAQALRSKGVQQIDVCCIARTPHYQDPGQEDSKFGPGSAGGSPAP